MASKRLIDANALLEEHCDSCSLAQRKMCENDPVCGSAMWIIEAPTLDAVEVVHAEWLDGYGWWGDERSYISIDCSNCGDYFKIESHDREYWKKRFKVCPFCGAVMDGERKDNAETRE